MCGETTETRRMLGGYMRDLVDESRRNLRRIEQTETDKAIRFRHESGTYRTVRRG